MVSKMLISPRLSHQPNWWAITFCQYSWTSLLGSWSFTREGRLLFAIDQTGREGSGRTTEDLHWVATVSPPQQVQLPALHVLTIPMQGPLPLAQMLLSCQPQFAQKQLLPVSKQASMETFCWVTRHQEADMFSIENYQPVEVLQLDNHRYC